MKRMAQLFCRTVSFMSVFLLLTVAPAFAQEGEASPADSTIGWVFRWLNFALVFGVMAWAIVKWGAPAFRAQANEISKKIAEGTRSRQAAELQRVEIQAKLAGLEREIQQLRIDAKRDADAEAQRLRDMARAESEKIEKAARAEIEAAARAGRMELKVLGARLAVERAESLLRQELTPKAEATLFGVFVAELERSSN